MISAKGHVYPLLLVRLALSWVGDGHASYRSSAFIFSTLRGLGVAMGPCAETIRLWLLRVGLYLLRRPVPCYTDWVYLLDLSIQVGQHKCLVILGVSLAQFRNNKHALDHRDVHVLAVQVLTRCTAETIQQALVEVRQRTGLPQQIVSDHGSEVLGGIRLFRAKNQQIIETNDITHALALLLKGFLEPDLAWNEFIKKVGQTRQQLQQTAGGFLRPPAWRQKSRYLNLEGHLTWANDMLLLLPGTANKELAEQLGCSTEQARLWLEEKMGWLREYEGAVLEWSYFQRMVKCAEAEIKNNGLSRGSWRRIRNLMRDDPPGNRRGETFRQAVVQLVKNEGSKLPARQRFVGSTDVLESLFGKYKELAERGPCREITANVLLIPLFSTTLTADLLREALQSVHKRDVQLWLEQQIGPSPQKRKRALIAAARQNRGDPVRG